MISKDSFNMPTPLRTPPAQLKRYPCVINKKLYTTIYAANLTAAKRKVRALFQELQIPEEYFAKVSVELLEFIHFPNPMGAVIINSYSNSGMCGSGKIVWSKGTILSDKEAVRKVVAATATVTIKK